MLTGLGLERMVEVISWGFQGQRLIKDFELVFRVRHFNHFFFLYFFFLCDGRMRRSVLSSCILQWQVYLWYAFWYRIGGERAFWDRTSGKKTQSSNTYSM